MDFERLASQLLKALRGRRSQTLFSRRLGYKSNVAHAWETGRGFPPAATLFTVAKFTGLDAVAAIRGFYLKPPTHLEQMDLTTAAGVSELLRDLKGRASLKQIAERVERDRFAVARWFSGQAEPRVPELLKLIDACTLRVLDFCACLVDPALLPEVRDEWRSLQAARSTAYEQPWSHAILRMLELAAYQRLPKHVPGWLASRLHITQNQETQCLEVLAKTGQIVWSEGRWRVEQSLTVDFRKDPSAARRLAAFWSAQGASRLENEGQGNFAYNVFGVSNADMERLKELQRAYFAQLRQIIAESTPVEQVAVVNLQLFPLTLPEQT